ncbi:hypothetical protein FB446DRAFT_449670 [Lentinula raphanica]|nr:hypothetical protein FB446DRAFT_449670 [Lentinula raphanica]
MRWSSPKRNLVHILFLSGVGIAQGRVRDITDKLESFRPVCTRRIRDTGSPTIYHLRSTGMQLVLARMTCSHTFGNRTNLEYLATGMKAYVELRKESLVQMYLHIKNGVERTKQITF